VSPNVEPAVLTSDLVRARVRGPTIKPSCADAEDPDVADLALRVHEAFLAAADTQARLGEVLAELEDVTQGGQAKLGKGLVRVAQDRCITEVESELDPAALRMEVFLKAAEQRPLAMSEVAPGCRTAAHVLAEVGAAHDISGELLAEQLYADLPSERRVESFEVPSPQWLVDRYNVALVQGLLVGATEVRVKLDKPTTPRMRQLVRWIKFEQLLCKILPHGEGFEIVLDGPVSLFGPSTRYGLNLARIFPAILLQEPPWQLEATVLWTRARLRKQLVVTSDDGFVSHYSDTGAYRSRAVEHLIGRFSEQVRGWHLSSDVVPIQLGKELLFPDFSLLHPEGHLVHVEVLGFWRASSLEQRLAALEKSPGTNLIFAVSRKLKGGEESLPEDLRVVPYTDAISPTKLVEAAETCIAKTL
jgi:predicted nuclease of restriction endonuclease-like RecB superfamily